MQNWNNTNSAAMSRPMAIGGVEVRPLMRLVYMWMGLGLLVTAFVALFIASDIERVISVAGFAPLLLIGQLGIVLALSFGISRMSPNVGLVLFFVYAGTMGLSLSGMIFAFIAQGQTMALANAFFTTAGLFGVMTVVGFTTKVDLSKFSAFFMMGLIGLVIAMVVNMFMQSDGFSLIISIIGVILFTGLTAWDTQKIKEMAYQEEFQQHSDSLVKLSIMGALTLYLDFINLFIFLLRIFAGNRD